MNFQDQFEYKSSAQVSAFNCFWVFKLSIYLIAFLHVASRISSGTVMPKMTCLYKLSDVLSLERYFGCA